MRAAAIWPSADRASPSISRTAPSPRASAAASTAAADTWDRPRGTIGMAGEDASPQAQSTGTISVAT
jgi:hypothetical protein